MVASFLKVELKNLLPLGYKNANSFHVRVVIKTASAGLETFEKGYNFKLRVITL